MSVFKVGDRVWVPRVPNDHGEEAACIWGHSNASAVGKEGVILREVGPDHWTVSIPGINLTTCFLGKWLAPASSKPKVDAPAWSPGIQIPPDAQILKERDAAVEDARKVRAELVAVEQEVRAEVRSLKQMFDDVTMSKHAQWEQATRIEKSLTQERDEARAINVLELEKNARLLAALEARPLPRPIESWAVQAAVRTGVEVRALWVVLLRAIFFVFASMVLVPKTAWLWLTAPRWVSIAPVAGAGGAISLTVGRSGGGDNGNGGNDRLLCPSRLRVLLRWAGKQAMVVFRLARTIVFIAGAVWISTACLKVVPPTQGVPPTPGVAPITSTKLKWL